MSTFKFIGDPDKGGLPRKSSVRIEAMPDRLPVFMGSVTESAYIDLDPGYYVYSVVRLTGGKASQHKLDDVHYQGEFYHEIEPDAWKIMQHMHARTARTMQTSEGTRVRCMIHGCDHETTNGVAALIHEVVDHLGIPREEFLKNPKIASRKAGPKQDALVAQIAAANLPTKSQIFGAIERSED